jgi:CheY-like chemotaxis protein
MALVLIVDDTEDLQETLGMILEDEGFQVEHALDGRRGLQMTRSVHPDVILLDIMMPEMDGLEFLSRLSAEPSPPPVVANSGFDGFRAEALRRGALAFLVKPLSLGALVGALRSAIERRSVAQAIVAENAAASEQGRQRALELTAQAVERLDAAGASEAGPCLNRIVHWLPTYFGFGMSLVHVLRGKDLCIAAIYNGPAELYEGARYPRETVYCDDVIAAGSTLVLTDPEHHPCEHFSHHKELLETGCRFYVGAPLKTPSGAVLGTVCLGDTCAHEFWTEDMHVIESLGLGAARGLELGTWPLDEEGAFSAEYRNLFVDAVLNRALRVGGAGVVITTGSFTPAVEAPGLAAVRLDSRRTALFWGGKADAPGPDGVGERTLARVDLCGPCDRETARARIQAIL